MPEKKEEKEKDERPKPETEPDDFNRLTRMFQDQMNLDSRTQAATMLGNLLKDAGVGQSQAEGVLEKMTKTLNQLPADMSMTRATADQKLSEEIKGQGKSQQLSQQTMQVLEPMMPYLMAFKMLDMFGNNQQERSGIEDLLLKKTVEEKFGEASGEDKIDQIMGELRRINTQAEQGEINRGTAIDQVTEQAEKLNDQMEKFGEAAESMGYKREDEGTLEKLRGVTEEFSEILGNLRESAPSSRETPERKVQPAEETEVEPEKRPSILSEEEEEPTVPGVESKPESKTEGEPEQNIEQEVETETESTAEEGEEPESEGRARDEEGKFVKEEDQEK